MRRIEPPETRVGWIPGNRESRRGDTTGAARAEERKSAGGCGDAPASVSGTVVRDGARAAASQVFPVAGASHCSRTLLRTPCRSGPPPADLVAVGTCHDRFRCRHARRAAPAARRCHCYWSSMTALSTASAARASCHVVSGTSAHKAVRPRNFTAASSPICVPITAPTSVDVR